jgi:hypothetical protein
MSKSKEYHQEYYKQHRTEIIQRQMEYHQENREKYLGYMREYNKQYYLKHHVPKPKKIKEPKPKREPKPPKEITPPKEIKPRKKRELHFYTPKEPSYVMKIERGNFVLDFFN